MAARRLVSVPAAKELGCLPDLREAVRTSVAAMDWLTPADDAMKALALRLAEEIETARERAEVLGRLPTTIPADDKEAHQHLKTLDKYCNVTRVVGYLSPQLRQALVALTERAENRGEAKPVGGRLQALRDAAGKH